MAAVDTVGLFCFYLPSAFHHGFTVTVFFIPSLLLRWAWLLQWVMPSLWCDVSQVWIKLDPELFLTVCSQWLSECCGKTGLWALLTPSGGSTLNWETSVVLKLQLRSLVSFSPSDWSLSRSIWDTFTFMQTTEPHSLVNTQPNYRLSCRHWGETEL